MCERTSRLIPMQRIPSSQDMWSLMNIWMLERSAICLRIFLWMLTPTLPSSFSWTEMNRDSGPPSARYSLADSIDMRLRASALRRDTRERAPMADSYSS